MVPIDWEFYICPNAHFIDVTNIIDKLNNTNKLQRIVTAVGWLNKDRPPTNIRKEINALAYAAKKKNLNLFFLGVSSPLDKPVPPGIESINTCAMIKFDRNYIPSWAEIYTVEDKKGVKPDITEYVGLIVDNDDHIAHRGELNK
jgi:hypothetical protein